MSMIQRNDALRRSVEAEADERDLSPSQRDRYVRAEIEEYQKPELIR